MAFCVLIIEDEDILSSVLKEFLEEFELEADIAANGAEAISKLELKTYTAAVVDLGLPDINGFDVLRKIRLFSSVPIIIVTVRAEEAGFLNLKLIFSCHFTERRWIVSNLIGDLPDTHPVTLRFVQRNDRISGCRKDTDLCV